VPAPDKAACARSAEDGQRLRPQGKLREALAAFTICASDRCPDIIRSDCRGWLTETQSALPTVVVRATAAEDAQRELFDVEVNVDGVPLTGKLDGRTLAVNPGERHFSFSATGRLPLDQKVVVRVGEQHRLLTVILLPDRPPPAAALPAPVRTRVGRAARVLLLVGGASLAVSAGFGVAGWLEARSLRDSHCEPACDAGKVDSARRVLRVADVSLAAGLASLATAAGLIWLRPAEPSAQLQLVPLPGGAAVAMRFGAPAAW
jgi:hypothetical protein